MAGVLTGLGSSFFPLFTGVRGRGFLRSSADLGARRILAVFSAGPPRRADSEGLFRHGFYQTQDEAQPSEDVDDREKLA